MDVNHLYKDGPLMMGHRGSPKQAPENTTLSFQQAVDTGLKGIEVDVLCTKDGKVVCSHNHDLERETDGSGYIHESDFSELRGINAGVKFPQLGVTPIPTLAELVSALPKKSILNIEIKSIKSLDLQAVPKVVELIREHQLHGRVIISSFNPLVIGWVKMMDRTIPTAYLWSDENVPPNSHQAAVYQCRSSGHASPIGPSHERKCDTLRKTKETSTECLDCKQLACHELANSAWGGRSHIRFSSVDAGSFWQNAAAVSRLTTTGTF